MTIENKLDYIDIDNLLYIILSMIIFLKKI
jgi:hypothetical protein